LLDFKRNVLYRYEETGNSASARNRQENWRNVALKNHPCLSDEGASLDDLSEMKSIFRFLGAAAAFFAYFFEL
jgi:hypothetical protein